MSPDLHQIAMEIFSLCLIHSIHLELQWIPRTLNSVADEFSKTFDFDDWSVDDRIFQYFDKIWGPFTCDLFADFNNKKVQKFYSRFWTPGSSGVDAFAHDWSSDNSWIVPPPNVVCRVLLYLKMFKARGVLVVPKWKSALYWPMIWDESTRSFAYYIKAFVEYEKPKNFFKPGSDKDSIFSQNIFNSNVLVLQVSFC